MPNSRGHHRRRHRIHRYRIQRRRLRRPVLHRYREDSRLPGGIGMLMLSVALGAVVTAVFSRVLYLSWDSWENGVRWLGYRFETSAYDAAVVAGALVFLLSTASTMFMFHRK